MVGRRIATAFALVAAVAAASLLQGCGAVYVANQLSARSEATAAGIDADDRAALDAGDLGKIIDRYGAVPPDNLPPATLSLLCDVLLKFGELSQADECLAAYSARIGRGQADRDPAAARRMVAGKRALIALVIGKPDDALSLVGGATDEGSRYVRAVASARVGRRAEARAIAADFALQFKPRPVYYAVSLYAVLGDYKRALELLEDPQRRLLRDYGIVGGKDVFGTQINAAPFRLDIFDEFSFGWFGDVSLAPAANVYVEYLAARSLLELHRDDEARQRYDALLAFPYIEAYRDVFWRVLYDRARLAERAGDRAAARPFLERSIEAIEVERSSLSSEQARIAFVDDKQDVYRALIDLLLAQGQTTVALEYAERAQSRALVDLLASRQPIGATIEAQTAASQLTRDEGELTVSSSSDPKSVTTRLAVLRSAHSRIQAALPELAPLVTVLPVNFTAIRSAIGADEAAIEFVESGSRWHVFVTSGGKVTVHDINGADLVAHVTALRRAVTSFKPGTDLAMTRTLYNDLLADALKGITAHRLIIVPAGVLHYLPFGALNDGSEYLAERYILRVLPSLSVLDLPTRPRSGKGGLVIGNPTKDEPQLTLVAAEQEARTIAAEVPGSTLLIGSQATVPAFRQDIVGHEFFHFAGHGEFDQEVPLKSRLYFAKSADSSRFLTASDLYSMKFGANLAVLSACETGLSTVAGGDDVVGLVRGFLYAGPTTVIASLWSIDDKATAQLMVKFYAGYLAGDDPAKALQAAQVELIHKGMGPVYWAAFFVTSVAAQQSPQRQADRLTSLAPSFHH